MCPIDSLDAIIPTVQTAFTMATKGIVGFVGGADVNGSLAERVRVGQDIVWGEPVVGEPGDATPGATGPREGSLGALAHTIKIERQRNVPIPITGDQFKAMQGNIYPFLQDAFVKAIRKLVDEMDLYVGQKVLAGSSTAVISPNGMPFTSGPSNTPNMFDFSAMKRAFRRNGYEPSNFRLVAGPDALEGLEGANPNLFRANEFGSDELVRWGSLTKIQGFLIGSAPNFPERVSSTATNYVTSGYHDAGVREIAVTYGAGDFAAGSLVKIRDEIYGVAEQLTGGSGTLKLTSPLRSAVNDETSVYDLSVDTNETMAVAYDKAAVKILARPPAVPDGGDSAVDTMTFQDSVSRLVIEVALYKQYMRQAYDVRIAYGARVIDPDAVIQLLNQQ